MQTRLDRHEYLTTIFQPAPCLFSLAIKAFHVCFIIGSNRVIVKYVTPKLINSISLDFLCCLFLVYSFTHMVVVQTDYSVVIFQLDVTFFRYLISNFPSEQNRPRRKPFRDKEKKLKSVLVYIFFSFFRSGSFMVWTSLFL